MNNIFLRIGKYICLFGINLAIMSGTVYVTDSFKKYQLPCLLVSLVLLFLMSGCLPPLILFFEKSLLGFFYLSFTMFVFLSGFYNKEDSIFVSAFGLLLFWFVFTCCIPVISKKYKLDHDFIILSVLLIHLLFLMYSFVVVPVNPIRYRGVFSNSNGFGGECTSLGIMAFYLLISKSVSASLSFSKLFLFFILAVFCFYGSLISNSRNSVMVLGFIMFFSFFFLFAKTFDRSSKTKKTIIFVFFFLVVSAIFIYLFSDFSELVEKIIEKFDKKADDPLDKRTEKWDFIFSRLSFFGNGEILSFGAHSSYFSILDQYGYIPFISFSLFILWGMIKSFFLAFKPSNKNPIYYFCFFSFFGFGVMGLFEGMLLKAVMFLALYGSSFLIAKENTANEQNKSQNTEIAP